MSFFETKNLKVALITGEERIVPNKARYWVCTVEAMPQDIGAEFVELMKYNFVVTLSGGMYLRIDYLICVDLWKHFF